MVLAGSTIADLAILLAAPSALVEVQLRRWRAPVLKPPSRPSTPWPERSPLARLSNWRASELQGPVRSCDRRSQLLALSCRLCHLGSEELLAVLDERLVLL